MMGKPTKSGKNSYKLVAYNGYRKDGLQDRKFKIWTIPPGMTARQAEKEAARQQMLWEEQVRNGSVCDGNMRFSLFVEVWMCDYAVVNLKLKTVAEYKKLLTRINAAIGDVKLNKLNVGHLNRFYADLQDDGKNEKTGGKLSANTIHHYHRCISSILSKAVKWGYIPYSPASRAELPKLKKKETAHLDEADVYRLFELLQAEPMKYRAMIGFDVLTGLRRAELLGLRWCDVDFVSGSITVEQTSNYVSGMGIYTDTPKNSSSSRTLTLKPTPLMLLREYQKWQEQQKAAMGDAWQDKDERVFTNEFGAPVHPDSLTGWFADFVERNNLPKISLHGLRHTYAGLSISDGTPLFVVSKRMGHSQIGTTANIYGHMTKSADEKAAEVTEKFAGVVLTDVEAGREQMEPIKISG